MSDSLLVPVAQVAQIFGLTERRVQQLASDGIIPKAERGRYHFIESVRGYIKFLQERAFGKSENNTDSHHERTRLLSAKASLAELDKEERMGSLLRADVVHQQCATAAIDLANHMEAVPDRTAALLAAETDPIKCHKIILEDIRRGLADAASSLESLQVDDSGLSEDPETDEPESEQEA